MHDSISTDGPQRPRVRRGLGILVGVALMASPLALAPAASAQSGDSLGGLDTLLQGVLEGLTGGNTLGHLVGSGSSEQTVCYVPDGLGATLSCVVLPVGNAINSGPGAKKRIKAKRIGGSARWVNR